MCQLRRHSVGAQRRALKTADKRPETRLLRSKIYSKHLETRLSTSKNATRSVKVRFFFGFNMAKTHHFWILFLGAEATGSTGCWPGIPLRWGLQGRSETTVVTHDHEKLVSTKHSCHESRKCQWNVMKCQWNVNEMSWMSWNVNEMSMSWNVNEMSWMSWRYTVI